MGLASFGGRADPVDRSLCAADLERATDSRRGFGLLTHPFLPTVSCLLHGTPLTISSPCSLTPDLVLRRADSVLRSIRHSHTTLRPSGVRPRTACEVNESCYGVLAQTRSHCIQTLISPGEASPRQEICAFLPAVLIFKLIAQDVLQHRHPRTQEVGSRRGLVSSSATSDGDCDGRDH